MKDSKSKPAPKRSPRPKKTKSSGFHQVTTAEFQREGMGVAPKE